MSGDHRKSLKQVSNSGPSGRRQVTERNGIQGTVGTARLQEDVVPEKLPESSIKAFTLAKGFSGGVGCAV